MFNKSYSSFSQRLKHRKTKIASNFLVILKPKVIALAKVSPDNTDFTAQLLVMFLKTFICVLFAFKPSFTAVTTGLLGS